MKSLVSIFKNVFKIVDANLLQYIEERSWEETYRKGEIILSQGKKQEKLPFLINGAFRGYRITEDGRELTECVCTLYGAPACFSLPLKDSPPLDSFMEALVETKVAVLSVNDLEYILSTFPEVGRAASDVALLFIKLHRETQYKNAQTLSQQYYSFLEDYPTLINCLSDSKIAVCINTSPQALSRALRSSNKDYK